MDAYLLQMGKNQMVKGWNSINFADYKEILGEPFHSRFESLYNILLADDVEAIDPVCHTEYMQYYELVKDWITILNYNTTSDYPKELVYALKLIMKEWLPDYDKYIILISDNPYMVTYPPNYLDAIYQNIESRYSLKIEHKVLKICMPKMFVDDFLVNVCMYHEIGHFIDQKNNLYGILAGKIVANSNTNEATFKLFNEFFPELIHPYTIGSNLAFEKKFCCHVREYLADIFAAQYVGDNILMYLRYLKGHEPNKEDDEHPSLSLRERMVCEFLSGGNIFIECANALTNLLYKGKPLCVRHHNGNDKNLGNLQTVAATNSTDIHSLLSSGWEIYSMDNATRIAKHPKTNGIASSDLYDSMNNLIKNSISNYSKDNPI